MDTHITQQARPDRRMLANALRVLAIDAVEAAKSGHPGMPMGMADIAETLWRHHLRHDPANPAWPNRDRFVLSNGHGSMLLYALLHLTGYDLPIDELRRFRQLHARTPGHPEHGMTQGVETTTGPLGQGLANAVGMALAEKLLADEFNRPGHDIVDHRTFVFVGDGCLMEGISHEACSLAGTLGLEKLTVIYDDNGISIDGHVDGWFADDTAARFEAYGWRVIAGVNGHDRAALDAAMLRALSPEGKPTLICCKTVIGWGAPNLAGSHDSHGAPLGAAEAAATKAALGWTAAPFEIPADIYAAWDARQAGARLSDAWNADFADYAAAYPELAAEFQAAGQGRPSRRFHDQDGGLDQERGGLHGHGRDPQGVADGDRGVGAAAAGIPRRLGRPDRLEPDQLERLPVGRPRRLVRQLHPLWRPRVRHGRDHERDRAAWRLASRSAARSWYSPTMPATACASRR